MELTELDAAIGDGDHGINLERGFTALRARLRDGADGNAYGGQLLDLTGRTLVSTVGGASGPLYGSFYLELATALQGLDVAAADAFGDALRAAAAAVGRRGRSSTGEKTMLDALVPAAEAWVREAASGASLSSCAAAAGKAAAHGRDSTRDLVATKGRASYLGERSRGHIDPGATSATLLVGALADAARQVEGRAPGADGTGEGSGASR